MVDLQHGKQQVPGIRPGTAHAARKLHGDLRDTDVCNRAVDRKFDEIYQFAADMGGAGFVFTGENDADIMHNSVMCNIHMMDVAYKRNAGRIFYSSSACIYPERNQMDALHPTTSEDSAYPAPRIFTMQS